MVMRNGLTWLHFLVTLTGDEDYKFPIEAFAVLKAAETANGLFWENMNKLSASILYTNNLCFWGNSSDAKHSYLFDIQTSYHGETETPRILIFIAILETSIMIDH